MLRSLATLWLPSLVDAAKYYPFGAQEDLAPRPLEEFCESGTGVRTCQHSISRRLDDGGDLHLDWLVQADPSKILSLDIEAERGVRIHRCEPGVLELELPDTHSHHAAVDQIITASHFNHNCAHLAGTEMYHRVVGVEQGERRLIGATGTAPVRLHRLQTEELKHLGHALPKVHFSFRYYPQEARDAISSNGKNVEKVTDDRVEEFEARELTEKNRLLTDSNSGYGSGGLDSLETLLSLIPKQIANLGWNWDFKFKTTSTPEFSATMPGATTRLVLRHPYIKLHAGIFMNFSSEHTANPRGIPHVIWKVGIESHGEFNARAILESRTTDNIMEDPLHRFNIPFLNSLEDTKWLGKIAFSVGNLPVSFEPGIQLALDVYHTGQFSGSLQTGLNGVGRISPLLSYDSYTGLNVSYNTALRNMTVWPPVWLMKTRHFESGMMLDAAMWVRGSFGDVHNARFAAEIRPYFNLTINRESSAKHPGQELKTFLAYPYRIRGLPENIAYDTRYMVKVRANGMDETLQNAQFVSSEAGLNWGDVTFHTRASNFIFGEMPQGAVLSQPVEVFLYQVTNGVETELGSAQVHCRALLNGECQPAPTEAPFTISPDGNKIQVHVSLAIIWADNPLAIFARKIKGISLGFPEVIVRRDICKEADPTFDMASFANSRIGVMDVGSGMQSLSVKDSLASVACCDRSDTGQVSCEAQPQGCMTSQNYDQAVAKCQEYGKRLCTESELKEGVCANNGCSLPEPIWSSTPDIPLTLRLTHSKRTWATPIRAMSGYVPEDQSTSLRGDTVFEIGQSFLAAWTPCEESGDGTVCDDNIVRLYHGSTLLGEGPLPSIPWTSRATMTSTNQDASGATVQGRKTLPVFVALHRAGAAAQNAPAATVRVDVIVESPAETSSFVQPNGPAQVTLDDASGLSISWTAANMHDLAFQRFLLTAYRLNLAGAEKPAESFADPGLGDNHYFTKVEGFLKTMDLQCSKFGSSYNSQAPCTFTYTVNFESQYFQANDNLMLSIEWASGDQRHVLYSQLVNVVAGVAAARRMRGSDDRLLEARHLMSEEQWQGEMARLSNDCQEKPLRVSMGAGLLFRARVADLDVPDNFPIIGGLNQVPEFSTGFKRIVAEDSGQGSELQDLLPNVLCEDGVCQGTLPGCQASDGQEWYFREIDLEFDRCLYFNDAPEKEVGGVRAVLAWAFSVLPETLEVILHHPEMVAPREQSTTPLAAAVYPGAAGPTISPTDIFGATQPPGTYETSGGATSCAVPANLADAAALNDYKKCLLDQCENAEPSVFSGCPAETGSCAVEDEVQFCPMSCTACAQQSSRRLVACDAATDCSGHGTTTDQDKDDGCLCSCTDGYSGPSCATVPASCNLLPDQTCSYDGNQDLPSYMTCLDNCCQDFDWNNGLLNGQTCQDALNSVADAHCNMDLKEAEFLKFPHGMSLMDICPATCGMCQQATCTNAAHGLEAQPNGPTTCLLDPCADINDYTHRYGQLDQCGDCKKVVTTSRRLDGAEGLPSSVKRVTLRFNEGAPRGLNDQLMQAMIDHDIIEPIQDARSRKLGAIRVQSFELKTGSASTTVTDLADGSPQQSWARSTAAPAALLGSLLVVAAIGAALLRQSPKSPQYEAAQKDDAPIE